jgi:hypothetical protein
LSPAADAAGDEQSAARAPNAGHQAIARVNENKINANILGDGAGFMERVCHPNRTKLHANTRISPNGN